MSGSRNETLYGNNVDFSGQAIPSPTMVSDGQLLIGATASPNIRVATLTAGTGVSITNAAGSITIGLSGSGVAVEHLTGNNGVVLNPDGSNNFTTIGTGSITIAGVGSTLTTQLTGISNNAIQIGAGTATLTQLGPTNRAVLTTGATGIPALTPLTDGQIIIGSSAGAPAGANITSTGGTVTVTNGSNTINLEVALGGFTWTDVTGATQAMSVENGYITDRGGGVVYTLPATASLGAEMIVMGKLGLATITPNANQQILIGSASGAVGATGTAVATNVGDCITLIATTSGASTVWRAVSFVGNWTLN